MNLNLLGICALALVASGCATNRGEMALRVAPAAVATTGGTPVFIDSITDNRAFENKPSEPSTPSLKGGKGAVASEEIKLKAVARKRNAYGKALGDIVLEGGQTVPSVMRDLLRESFHAAGYAVVDDRVKLGADGIEVDVKIEKFWAWATPGFFAASIESQLETSIVVTQNGKEREVAVRGYGKNSVQTGREANWVLAYERGFEDFKAKLAAEF